MKNMPRTQPQTIKKQARAELLNELWSLVALLKTKEEIENFFRDLLSETEAIMLARRIRIARLLLAGKQYEDIRRDMKTSYVTIAGVQRWLQGGDEDYSQLLPKLELAIKQQYKAVNRKSEKDIAWSFGWLKRKYPLHFLLFNLLDAKDPTIRKRKLKKSKTI